MKTFPLTPEGIADRLAQIEEERTALLALRAVYAADAPKAASTGTTSGAPLVTPTTATTGSPSAEILAIVGSNPGIRLGALIDLVLSRVTTSSEKPRKNIANIIGTTVKSGKIEKRADGFYLAIPKPQGGG